MLVVHAVKSKSPPIVNIFAKNILAAGFLLIWANLICAETQGSRNNAKEQPANSATALQDQKWIHGSTDCKDNTDPAIEVFRYDQLSYILRQNKCLSFEAPFIYVLIGDEKVLVLDTGAPESAENFPLYETVLSLLEEHSGEDRKAAREILVIHSHSHRDHYSGDSQFEGKPNVTVIKPNHASVIQFFAIDNWPDGEAKLQLGGREITIIPTPGHQEESVSVYDPHTHWLLTGDTFYPGYIYVKDWKEYKRSIARLVSFSEAREISAVLGAHIEMTEEAGEYYPIGTIYQPNEAPLTLSPENLHSLHSALEKSKKAQEIKKNEFIVVPMNTVQKTLSNMARWFSQ
jgi:glyoxylase-like metal-dependent hydrolase (beta-lactamase superfamily II)